MTRRELLWLTGAGLLSGADPQNLSYPLRSLQGAVTPSEMFFVRDHFQPPDLSLGTWKLRVEGRVQHPYELNFSDLVELPSRKMEAFLECAGNAANGSAISNGVWEGAPISVLLETARPTPAAAFVLLEGADRGALFPDRPTLPYTQIVPIEKCLDPSSLVVYKLNGLALPKKNGFPARALFAGWYGMDWVKWLQRIVVLGRDVGQTAFEQSGMNRVYNRVVQNEITRVAAVRVKSAIAWPANEAHLPAARHLLWGFAWSGSAPIRQVEVTTDGGKQWMPADLSSRPGQYAWTRWSCAWDAKPGEYMLMSRAIDQSGAQQPLQRDPRRKDTYELNWCAPVHCLVR